MNPIIGEGFAHAVWYTTSGAGSGIISLTMRPWQPIAVLDFDFLEW